MTDEVRLFLYVSLFLNIVGIAARALLITVEDYPRTTRWTAGQDVGVLIGSFIWLFWIAWLLWGGQ